MTTILIGDSARTAAPASLEFAGVSLTLGNDENQVHALVDIDLKLARGELVAVTGRSAAGKSSLLNVAGGLVEPTTGAVHVMGRSLGDLDKNGLAQMRRQAVGFVFQDLNLIATLTAAENVSLPMELDGMSVREARAKSIAALTDVGVVAVADRFPDQMSGGQRQRVAIARGLVGERSVLLADEPTGALDEITAEGIMVLLRKQCDQGAATLMVTHDPALAAWADRVVRLRDGRIESISVRAVDPKGAQ